MDRLNVAFVGCGHIALEYVGVYCRLPWVRLALCVDIDEGLAQSTAQHCTTHGVTAPRVSTRFEDALAPEIDIVVINTPNDLHRPQAVAAMHAGKHVLLQKPLAADLADAERIAEVARTAKGTIGMYMSYLDQPVLHDLRDLVTAGYYGDVVEFYGRSMHPKGMLWSAQAQNGQQSWRNSIRRTGGGCFIQLAVHYIHLAKWILGARIVEVRAFTANLHSPGLEGEDLGMAWMRTDLGARILLSTAWCASGDQLSITGTEGSTDYLYNSQFNYGPRPDFCFNGRALRLSGSDTARRSVDIRSPGFGDCENPLNQHRRFLEAVRDGLPVDVTVEEALEDMHVLTACYRSASIGAVVPIRSTADVAEAVAQ